MMMKATAKNNNAECLSFLKARKIHSNLTNNIKCLKKEEFLKIKINIENKLKSHPVDEESLYELYHLESDEEWDRHKVVVENYKS